MNNMKSREDICDDIAELLNKLKNDSWSSSRDIADILFEVLSLSELGQIQVMLDGLFGNTRYEDR
jgi:hypothetical protein